MKRYYILLYHSIYWIYRIINIMTFVYLVYGESWYKGSYAVLLILMPFFYVNYGILIPWLIQKKYKIYFFSLLAWMAGFVFCYSRWTVYQGYILNHEAIRQADYVETLNNLIYIWLISTGFCLFEFWIRNRDKNSILIQEQNVNLLKSEQNIMLNKLLLDYFNTLDNRTLEEIPDKILLVSDFFKYLLYSREKIVTLKTEISYINMYAELKNSNTDCIRVHYGLMNKSMLIRSSHIISVIDILVTEFFTGKVLEIDIVSGETNEVLISTPIPAGFVYDAMIKKNEFLHSVLKHDTDNGRFVIHVSQYFIHTGSAQIV